MASSRAIPDHVRADGMLMGRFRAKLADATGDRLDQGEWSKFLALHDLEGWIGPRFMQSVQWGNEDRDALILKLITRLVNEGRDEALVDLFERAAVQRWFKQKDPEFLELWAGASDPLLEAVVSRDVV